MRPQPLGGLEPLFLPLAWKQGLPAQQVWAVNTRGGQVGSSEHCRKHLQTAECRLQGRRELSSSHALALSMVTPADS